MDSLLPSLLDKQKLVMLQVALEHTKTRSRDLDVQNAQTNTHAQRHVLRQPKRGKRRRERNCDNLVTNDVGDGAHFELLMSVSQEYMSTATDVDACDANLNENSTSEKCQLEEEEKT